MKKLVTLLFACLIANFAFGQEDDYKTLFGNSDGSTDVSGFGTVSLDFGSVNGDFALFMGGEGAVLFNKSFYVGLYGRGLTTMPTYNYSRYSPSLGQNISYQQRAMFGHGGLLIGAILNPSQPFHLGFSTKIGMGGIGLFDDFSHGSAPSQSSEYLALSPLFVFTPQVDLEINLTEWFKFRVSGGYQFVSNEILNYQQIGDNGIIEKELLNSSDFSTPTFSLGFVFGWFK